MKIEILSHQEMWERYREESLEDTIKYLNEDTIRQEFNFFNKQESENFFFCLMNEEKIVGVLKLKTKGVDYPSYPGFYNCLGFCSIKEEFIGKGYSSLLVSALFEFLKENGHDHLISSGYSNHGHSRLRKNLLKQANIYNIKFMDEDKIMF